MKQTGSLVLAGQEQTLMPLTLITAGTRRVSFAAHKSIMLHWSLRPATTQRWTAHHLVCGVIVCV